MVNMQNFWEQLNRGPAVLFLGQDYLRSETGSDPLLREVRGRFGGSDESSGYRLLFEGTANESGDSALAWMSERCRRLSPPEWVQSVAAFPWNSVFSSAIDPLWHPAFRNDWREVAPVYDHEYYPSDPRNRRVLHCTHLFGSLNSSEPAERPPLSSMEFLARIRTARNLADRLKDTVTPMGVLAIAAYNGDSDWFSLDEFYPFLLQMEQGQVHLFDFGDRHADNPILTELVRLGKVVNHQESLAWVLNQGITQGFIHPRLTQEVGEDAKRVTLRNIAISIPRELWNRVTNSAVLLDDQALTPPAELSDDALYWEFRRFLFESGTRPLWSGFARGFAFKREFEDRLQDTVLKRIGRPAPADQPIVIHGQTGTGKTVALGSLAYTTAKSGQYPVLFIERRTQRPVYSDIDECCRWMEDRGAQATLVVWDGMVQQSEYHELQGYLASRGRKAVVVGSTYGLGETRPNLIAVPDQLSHKESKEFAEFLSKKGIVVSESHREALQRRDPSYLVALYRYLAPARRQITSGVVQELELLEQELVASVNQTESMDFQPNALAEALFQAGVIDRSHLLQAGLAHGVEVSLPEIADMVDIVTVPGRFGINIPIELLARTWGKTNFADVAQILRNFDLIQAFEDSSGRVVVGPRHSLEAQLIVQARLGGIRSEAHIVGRIVRSIRPWTWGADENDDIGFTIELLRAVGPQGNEQFRFAPYFRAFAEAISEVRESRNIQSPRLMLQEANFFREWVTTTTRQVGRPLEANDILSRAQSTLQEALEMFGDSRQWRLRSFIATELASTYGAATVDSINACRTDVEIEDNFRRVLRAVKSARQIDSSAYNPVDVLVWSTTAFLDREGVEDATRTEAIVDVLDALKTVDPDLLDSGHFEQFHRRRYEIGKLQGDEGISESAFQSLKESGSAAGYYLRALEIVEPPTVADIGHESAEKRHDEAWRYLEQHRLDIENDPRCLNLLFDYWWLSKTGQRPFESERVPLAFQEHDWLYCLQLINTLKGLESLNRGPALSFLQAIAQFHLGRISEAIQLFREVENESFMVSSRRRILRSFLASEPSGRPSKFHGTVRSAQVGGRRGQVFVEELRQNVTFLPVDFGRPEVRRGDSLGEFHIAFNFIGPIADPLERIHS